MSINPKSIPNEPLKVLIIGTFPPPIGGAGVLLKYLTNTLNEHDEIKQIIVNTSGVRGAPFLYATVKLTQILLQLIIGIYRCDVVSLHAAPTGLYLIGPFVCILAQIGRRPFIVRKFGGTDYLGFNGWRRMLARWVVKSSNLYLTETNFLVEAARKDGVSNVKWYPNNRPLCESLVRTSANRGECKRFVFLSQIKRTKGIYEVISAAEKFGKASCVEVYGPFFNGLSEKIFDGLKSIRYRGIVDAGKAVEMLHRYDALLLPTYYEGEGQPGIILEAFCAGIPVITTKWKGIPEIADESCAIFVEPRNAQAIYEAMNALAENKQFYTKLCHGASQKARLFDSRIWAERFVEYCRNLHIRPSGHGT